MTRRRGGQGPQYKAPLVRERIWEWFVDFRGTFMTTVSPKYVLKQARFVAEEILREQHKLGFYEPLPVLDRHWLLRWKRDYGVVFRRPNMRFKCGKAVLLQRLRAMWRNVIVVRRIAEHFLHNDLSRRFVADSF